LRNFTPASEPKKLAPAEIKRDACKKFSSAAAKAFRHKPPPQKKRS
jgi:hypothetical protein